jgi:hypothetical protein
MSSIPSGAVVTVVVGDAQTVAGYSGALNAGDVLSAVSAYLNALGAYQVQASSASGNILSTISPLIQETFQATLRMQTNWATDTDQIDADIASAFAQVTGQTPSNITIPSYTSGANAKVIPTGQAAATDTPSQGISDSIAKFFAELGSTAKSLLIGLAAILLIAMVLIAYGPNVRHIAAAV